MTALSTLISGLASGAIEVVDLTAPLSSETPILQLPEQFGQTQRFELEEISHYDDRGPGWYWNNFHTGEHTGTHFDAPNHWVTGKDKDDIASVPVTKLIGPAAVLDFSAQVAENPDFLIEIDDVRAWETAHGPLPDGGWLLVRTGWDARTTQDDALNADETGCTAPGSPPSAHAGSRRNHRSSAWASRPSAPTLGLPTRSSRRSRATPT